LLFGSIEQGVWVVFLYWALFYLLMSWVLFALGAAFTFALTNVIDKFILSKWIENELIPVVILGFVGLVFAGFVYFFRGFSFLSWVNVVLAFLAGVVSILFMVFYFRAVQVEEVSRVVPLFSFVPVFTAVLAAFFLGEIFSVERYFGVVLVVAGSLFVSVRSLSDLRWLRLGRAFWFMVLAAFFSAVFGVMVKYLLEFSDYLTVFSYTRLGAVVAVIPLFYFYLPDLKDTVRKHEGSAVSLISFNGLLGILAALLMTIALSIGYATLVNTLGGIQPFFVLFLTVFLSLFFPGVLEEELDRVTVVVKVFSISLMLVGVYLVV